MFTLTRLSPLHHCISLLLTVLYSSVVAAQSFYDIEQSDPGIRVEQLFSGLGIPWGMAFIAPQRMLITERKGQAHLLDLQTRSVNALRGLPKVVAKGQGGLLDVVVGPNYQSDGWIYFTYSKPANKVRWRARALTTCGWSTGRTC